MGASPRWRSLPSSRSGCCAARARARFRSPLPPDLDIHRLAAVPTTLLTLPLLAASLPVALPAFTGSSASPGNVLATLRVDPPPSVGTIVNGDGSISVVWDASPSAASRAVGYIVLRRASGTTVFAEIARVGVLTYSDRPVPGSYDYMIRTFISTFMSADSAIVSAVLP